MTEPQWEDVTKAATREEAIEEDRQYDILLVGGWVKVCQDAYGNLLSPVMFRHPTKHPALLSSEDAFAIEDSNRRPE